MSRIVRVPSSLVAFSVASALFIATTPVAAQQGPPMHAMPGQAEGRMGAGMMGGPMNGMAAGGAMFAHVPSLLLEQKDLLKLSDDQVQKIKTVEDSIRAMYRTRRAAMPARMDSLHQELEGILGPGGLDVNAYRTALQGLAQRRVAAAVQTADLAQRAISVLNADQRGRFLYGLRLLHQMQATHTRRGMMRRPDERMGPGRGPVMGGSGATGSGAGGAR